MSSTSNGFFLNDLAEQVHKANQKWWLQTCLQCEVQPGLGNSCPNCHGKGWVRKDRNVGEMLMLIVSELAEALEGDRKNLMDDKLPHRPMLEVELADAIIRILDMGKGLNLDVGGAFVEKMAYNAQREDHKLEARMAPGGKKY